MAGLRVLISGASVAGPALAHYLSLAGAKCTVVERAPALRSAGQNVDIRGPGLDVIRRMGIEESVTSNTTQEEGLRFVDSNSKTRAEFPVDPSGQSNSFTAEVEILRGVLSKIIYDKVKDSTEFIFGDSISKTTERENDIEVNFASGSTRAFDIVVIAEGLNSRTRTLVFNDLKESPIVSLGQYMAYFSMPKGAADDGWARWYNATGRRTMMLRPDNFGGTRCLLGFMPPPSEESRLLEAVHAPEHEQRELLHELFADAGWETERILKGLDTADDLYFQQIGQVKMNSWSRGRVIAVGDSAYCPSPISGMGTTSALVGAYILAGEISRQPQDHRAAFQAYEERMRPFIDDVQRLPPGAPKFAAPSTNVGIEIFYTTLGFVSRASKLISKSRISKVIPDFSFLKKEPFKLPSDYTALGTAQTA